MGAGLRIEPVTADLLAEEAKPPAFEVTCPVCGLDTRLTAVVRDDPEILYWSPASPDHLSSTWPGEQRFEVDCGCYLRVRRWKLHVPADGGRAWFEANR